MRAPFILVIVSCCAAQQSDDGPDPVIPPVHTSITITATPVEPAFDRRNSEVFSQTLFSRDDQMFQALDAGLDAGQHEGGGKSLEIRRLGFNLDHGGVNGGLKVLVEDVPQNQTTQGHGQGYLGSLKSLSPELIQEVQIINGPFSAEYGDFSGLGVVHIRLRESLPDQLTLRLQGGSFGSLRSFLSYSPSLKNGDAFVAYEGSRTDGPFKDCATRVTTSPPTSRAAPRRQRAMDSDSMAGATISTPRASCLSTRWPQGNLIGSATSIRATAAMFAQARWEPISATKAPAVTRGSWMPSRRVLCSICTQTSPFS